MFSNDFSLATYARHMRRFGSATDRQLAAAFRDEPVRSASRQDRKIRRWTEGGFKTLVLAP